MNIVSIEMTGHANKRERETGLKYFSVKIFMILAE